MVTLTLSEKDVAELRGILEEWLREGFTTHLPGYEDAPRLQLAERLVRVLKQDAS